MNKIKILILSAIAMFIFNQTFAQKNGNTIADDLQGGVITTSVPFLLISPDARSGSLGDIGAASSPDPYSQHWNPAKYAFINEKIGASITYSPWLRNMLPDMNLIYLTGFYKYNERSAFASSLTYFSLGEVIFTQSQGMPGTVQKPNEFAVDFSYSNKLTEHFSLAVAGRYIRSDLTQGVTISGQKTKAAQTGAADVAMFYTRDIDVKDLKNSTLSLGLDISNIGGKLKYSNLTSSGDFLPCNLRIGGAYKMDFDEYNSLTVLMDLNKLLVPTPPAPGDTNAIDELIDMTAFKGIITSFSDAPGGFKEELQEITWSFGLEYWYANLLALRGGYFYENIHKGNRKYFTLGFGIKYNFLGLDISYLIPVSDAASHPLKNTLRFSLIFNIDSLIKSSTKSWD